MTLTTFLTDLISIIDAYVNMFINTMQVFMEPPLVILVALWLFGVIFGIFHIIVALSQIRFK